ncbi:genetic suppressor element 1-like isoform X1 [Electrophorus electricus]|uniref:genetic suppressor element 1-like isoform X1 n=2 Tax=Electrophorus electricus TaxID=8005 RepID=UPI0015CFA397|nr:genetic suppressor element 1-like isoform X1 [Electrophorus electricus]
MDCHWGAWTPLLLGMSHEPKSPSLGMISTATRTTATISPLTPSPINGVVLANGNPASQSAHSGFAAALRKLAKQAEEPRGSASISGESSPVSSPATNHSSPVGTPKRGPLGSGAGLGALPGAHSVSSTPPVVTIAPTKTVNGLWRSEGRQAEAVLRGAGRGRLASDPPTSAQDKSTTSLPPHLVGAAFPFGLSPSAVMQDPRLQALNLSRQVPHVLQSGAVPEEYLRSGFRPYGSAEELRVSSLPLGLDPGTAAYFHSGYLSHPTLSAYRMDESLCLSALRSPYYQLPAGGALPSLHPSAAHLHLPGVRYPADLTHQSLSALQTERLQMEDNLRQRERERERDKERALEAEREREREKERERERERELERQKERAKEREAQVVRAMEKNCRRQELHTLSPRQHGEDRAKLGDRLTAHRAEKTKEASALAPQPLQPGVYPLVCGPAPQHAPYPSPSPLLSPCGCLGPGGGAVQGSLAATLFQRRGEEERWMARPQRLRAETEDRPGPAPEPRQHGPELGAEPREAHRNGQRSNSHHLDMSVRDLPHHLGAPPPLISPRPSQRDHPPNPPTTLWNPASLIDSPSHTRRGYDPPNRAPPGLMKPERSEEGHRRPECPERGPPPRTHALLEPGAFLTDMEKSTQSILNQRRASLCVSGPCGEPRGPKRAGSPIRATLQSPGRATESGMVYDQALQQHRKLLSKLDLEEKRRREARDKGYYHNDSSDESDEEEMRAHLQRVAKQPPLKLDQSKKKLDFLSVFGLTTLSQRDKLLERKRRKRRRMMKERSPSPGPAQGKRQTPWTAARPLTTRYSPEEMDRGPELEDKKHFLNMFNLNHVSTEQRIEKEKVVNLLNAIKQKAVTLDTLRYATDTPCSSPPVASDLAVRSTPCQSNGVTCPDSPRPPSTPGPHRPLHPDLHRPPSEPPHPKEPPPLAPLHSQAHYGEAHPNRRPPGLQANGRPAPGAPRERGPVPNGLSSGARPWESLSAEEFAQHFHQSVLQSTQKSKQKHKGVPGLAESNHKVNNSMRYNPPDHQGPPSRLPYSYTNGHSCYSPAHRGPSGLSDEHSAEEESSEEDNNDEEESYSPKWKGIEAIFEAYQEYAAERSLESEVLQTECRRLEAQHYHLSVTADQLSVSMGELLAQRQRLALERERMHAQLEHFRRCLVLPTGHLRRGHYKGLPPR